MSTKTKILHFVARKKIIRTSDVIRFSKISRQAAAKHLRELVALRKLCKEGSTHRARYSLFDPKRAASARMPGINIVCRIRGLEEDRVWEDLSRRASLAKKLSVSAFKIVRYAFTEMLNNAIDHSRADRARIELQFRQGTFFFRILDRGIGAFESVRRKFRLKDHFEAAEHLLKGKQTTAPDRHSGRGEHR